MDNLETPEPYKAVEKRPTIFDCQSMINIRGMASQLKLSQDTTKHLQDIYDFATIADASVDSEKQLLNTTNAVCTCFKAILSVSPMVLILQEVQLTDIYTLSVLKDVIDNCDNACVFMFGRPGFTFENKSCKVMIDSIQQSDFVNHIELKGFNLSDTKELIQQIWDEEALTSVSQDIALNILTRTAGNPYLIESLTSSMKVTGKWVISVTGELVSATKDLDGDALSLGYDNQGVVLARFDRLDRNMQLFFKIAAVIGEKFCLDDVLYFMTGIEGISKDMDSKTYNGLVKGVVTSDQYGFLQLDSKGGAGGGAYFAFKSSLVRKCVYNLMAHKQRQHAHLHAAQYLESRITDANKNESYLSIFEHYMETSDVHMEKKIYYLELVAASYYKFGICNEAIKYYRLLCELCSRMNMLQNPNYYRELGDMLLSAGYLVDGHRNINESLYHQDIEVPHSARKMAQQYAKLDAAQKKENVNFFAQAIFNVAETPYQMPAISSTRSSMSRRGRKMSLIPAGVQVNNPQAVNAVSPLFHDARISKDLAIQHCFWLLAEYYRMIEDFESHKYVVLAGLVKHASCQNQSITAMLYSSAALIARLTEPNKSTLSKSYMRVATGLDNRSDITVSAKILKNQSFLALINEEFELANELMSKCIACCRLLSSKKTSMRCKSVQVFVGSLCKGRQVSYTTGKAILSECQTSGYIYERFWGNFHCLHLLLLEEGSANQIFPNEPLFLHLQELIEFQRECPPDLKNLLKIKMATSVLDLYVAIMTDKPVPWLALNMLHDNFKKASRGDWIVVIALLPLVAGLLVAHARDLVKPRSIEGKLLDKTLGEINNSLKRINLPFREPFRRAFKGIRLLFSSTPTKACVAWKKGLQDNSDNLYIQGLLNFVIGHYGQSPQHLQKGLSVIKSLGYDYLAVMISKQKRGHDKT